VPQKIRKNIFNGFSVIGRYLSVRSRARRQILRFQKYNRQKKNRSAFISQEQKFFLFLFYNLLLGLTDANQMASLNFEELTLLLKIVNVMECNFDCPIAQCVVTGQ